MEEPFVGATAMNERVDHPQVLLSKGNEPARGWGSVQEDRASRTALQAGSRMPTGRAVGHGRSGR